MADNLNEAVEAIKQGVAEAYAKVESKGGTMPSQKNLNNLSEAIESIQGGGGGASLGNRYRDITTTEFERYDVEDNKMYAVGVRYKNSFVVKETFSWTSETHAPDGATASNTPYDLWITSNGELRRYEGYNAQNVLVDTNVLEVVDMPNRKMLSINTSYYPVVIIKKADGTYLVSKSYGGNTDWYSSKLNCIDAFSNGDGSWIEIKEPDSYGRSSFTIRCRQSGTVFGNMTVLNPEYLQYKKIYSYSMTEDGVAVIARVDDFDTASYSVVVNNGYGLSVIDELTLLDENGNQLHSGQVAIDYQRCWWGNQEISQIAIFEPKSGYLYKIPLTNMSPMQELRPSHKLTPIEDYQDGNFIYMTTRTESPYSWKVLISMIATKKNDGQIVLQTYDPTWDNDDSKKSRVVNIPDSGKPYYVDMYASPLSIALKERTNPSVFRNDIPCIGYMDIYNKDEVGIEEVTTRFMGDMNEVGFVEPPYAESGQPQTVHIFERM